ncbi:cupin domain-containing protein [Kushneria phosphatilytica]|uniref:Cupin domain-containing protein n=1 Tax=Kushneria phosphatilytica TaxID=657387 RepID=A0A1S1NYZ6_9GAMM|nr:cupin domain-containing protein [Kushneria phosphatilytica]OHV12901.1 hypothetical protein BH688_02495 [Kushneria phosphatilytica]QEL10762.1 cupin domain-containing protein [Kushneria phosphatilytica]
MDHIKALIEHYALEPHPEGGYFAQVYRGHGQVTSPVHGEVRASATHIYFLLPGNEKSRFHRVLHDELWQVYEGAPLRLVRGDGTQFEALVIGPGCPDHFAVVEGGQWQGAESTGAYTLCGCTVAPGFEFDDFTLMTSDMAARLPKAWRHLA